VGLGDDAQVQTSGDQERPASLGGGHAALELLSPNVPCSMQKQERIQMKIQEKLRRTQTKPRKENNQFKF
jgi:hypothetical protein